MSECEHPWKQIQAKEAGVIECAGCHQRWRGPAAEFVWRRANQAITELNRRLEKLAETFETHFKMLSCEVCGAFFPRGDNKYGLNINGSYVCYGCAPEWLNKVGNHYDDERDRRYARMMLARWLSQHWYFNRHTAALWRELEAEIIQVLKDKGSLSFWVN